MNQVSDPERFYIEQIMPYKIELNLYYVENRTFRNDIYLIIATFLKIINKAKIQWIVKDEILLNKKNELVGKIGVEY